MYNKRVLFVHSGNSNSVSPFIIEQAKALISTGLTIDYYSIIGKGVFGYLKNLAKLKNVIKKNNYDLIHAHYGYSGLLSVFSSNIPLVITFHGTDITNWKSRLLSQCAMTFSDANIFVSTKLKEKVKYLFNGKSHIIPCGVDMQMFKPSISNYKINQCINILFASSFDNSIKNYPLARKAIDSIDVKIKLIELRNKSRKQVVELLNMCDLLLLTSLSEGSPQIIKEAMSCNCPIVATNVGDIEWVIGKTKGCFLTSFDPFDISKNIKKAIEYRNAFQYTDGRNRILQLSLDNSLIAEKIISVYKKVLNK